MKFQFLTENFSRSEKAPPFETRKIRQFEVERIFLKNKKMLHHFFDSPPTGLPVGFFVSGVNLSSTRVLPESGESPLFSYDGVFQTFSR